MRTRRAIRLGAVLWLAAAIATAVGLSRPPLAAASRNEVTIMQDPRMLADPAGYLARFRAFGATTVRVFLYWDSVAPASKAKRMPSGFDGSDVSAYPQGGWAPYDETVRAAANDGMNIDFVLTGGPPRWATGPGAPRQESDPYFAWKPNSRLYGQFVHAVAERYDGSFTPPGASAPLPAVHFWTLWNEPNFGEDLGPQAIDGSTVSIAPSIYRQLVDTGWSALHQTGHGQDTILIGGLAAEGLSHRPSRKYPLGLPGDFSQTKPLKFVRTLYCLDTYYRELRGRAARAVDCPANAAGSRRFRAQNPALFAASGFADHPYNRGLSPVNSRRLDPNFATFPVLGRFERELDRVNRIYGSRRHFPIYNDEFGYITHPPQTATFASPTQAAYYLNWSEYISWRSPRLVSFAQYLLSDPRPQGTAGFASGLLTVHNRPKATYNAFRLPVYMPRTTVRRSSSPEVWGCVRPAGFMSLDTSQPQTVAVQLQANGHGPFRTLRTVTIVSPQGYFDLHMRFPSSGYVRLAYTYPTADSLLTPSLSGATVISRLVRLTTLR